MATVLLVRHGRTSANTAGILAGRSPGVELDDLGRTQAADLGQRMTGVALTTMVTSPLRRCRQTTQALAAARTDPLPISVDTGLVECGYGDWTNRSLKELSKERLWRTVQQQPSAVRFPGGEAMTEMAARAVGTVRRWDEKLNAEHGEDAVWVAVSHGDVIKAILADALGTHLDTFQRILVNPASVSVVRYTAARPYVVTMNSSGHDLRTLFPPRKPGTKRARRSRASHDAPVGGGLGTHEPTAETAS
ncbi:MAG: MSMEG_4193 family putative phosphomutase [Microlunatus sp.]|nr:MSMEG_4193 family putative phosphomutase [Microlunatus sp.]MDN5770476.1 MSMEG_4193 family putative phosphomutase [Microlunatus sp.]